MKHSTLKASLDENARRIAENGNATTCTKCGGVMRPGIAMGQTFSGSPDFIGGDVVTVSAGGPGRLIACLKCSACGHSKTPNE